MVNQHRPNRWWSKLPPVIVLLVTFAMPWSPGTGQPQTQQSAATATIEPGQSRSSSFPAEVSADAIPFHDYELRLSANQTVRIDMESPAPASGSAPPSTTAESGFDTFIELRLPEEDEPLRIDDDSGDGLNSSMVFTSPSDRIYIVRARPLGMIFEDQAHSYVLRITELPSPPPPQDFAGPRVEGELGPGSPEDVVFEPVRYAAYRLRGRAGERILLEMSSNGRQPGLQVVNENGVIIATDVGFDRSSVRVVTVLPDDGDYIVRALSPAAQTVSYSVALSRAMAVEFRPPQRIAIGPPITGTLSIESNATDNGFGQADSFYDLYIIDVLAGQPVTVELTSDELEGMLEAGTATVLGFVPELTSFEFGSDPARLVIRPFQSGPLWLRVRSAGLGVGNYQLSVSPSTPVSE